MAKIRILLLAAALVSTACSSGTATPTQPSTPTPSANNTLPAPTGRPPSPTAGHASPTGPAPTQAPAEASPTRLVAATDTPTGPVLDRAEFLADVTIPDGTDLGPGATFTKTWRVKNAGTSSWTKEYVLEFALGVNMAAVNKVNLPGDVAPGAAVDISIDMTAPATPGAYTSLWQFLTPGGNKFGVGPNFNEAIYAQIDVVAGLPIGTPAPVTAVPTASGPLNPARVTKVTMSVDTQTVTGKCPHTFIFTAILNIEGGGPVRYRLEASTTTEGFQFQLPAAIESVFTTNGPHVFGASFTLDMRDTVQGQAWLHVLSPNDLVSEKLAFSLTCPAPPTRTPVVASTSGPTATASGTAAP